MRKKLKVIPAIVKHLILQSFADFYYLEKTASGFPYDCDHQTGSSLSIAATSNQIKNPVTLNFLPTEGHQKCLDIYGAV